MNIKFQGQFDKNTLFKAIFLANRPSRRNILSRIAIAALLLSLYFIYFMTFGGTGDLSSSFQALRSDGRHLLAPLLAAYFIFLPYISSYFSASNLWKQPDMRTPVSGTVSPVGITFTSSPGERREIRWENFAKKQSAPNLVLLLTGEGKLSIFPRNFFESDAAWESFLQAVDSKVTVDDRNK